MGQNLAQKLIASHLVEGRMEVGTEIGLKIDQTLTQDATGTLVMLELEALQRPHVRTELSARYVDHNLLQTDVKNADDHLFLRSACQKFGLWNRRPATASAIPCLWNTLVSPVKASWARIAIHVRPARWPCWPAVSGGSRWLKPWRASPFISRCRASGGYDSRESFPTG